MAQLGARLDGIEEVVGSNPIGSTKFFINLRLCDSLRLRSCAVLCVITPRQSRHRLPMVSITVKTAGGTNR